MTIYSFGDSWAYGSELQSNEYRFGDYLADYYNQVHKNYGERGWSLGAILHKIVTCYSEIDKNDLVCVIIPPDTRWYVIQMNYPLTIGGAQFFNNNKQADLSHFIYHHSLFIMTIQNLLNRKKCNYVMAHNYGQLELDKHLTPLIDLDCFLSNHSLTALLNNGNQDWKNNLNTNQDGPSKELFSGKYFAGNTNHPNTLGHKKIAQLMIDYFDKNK